MTRVCDSEIPNNRVEIESDLPREVDMTDWYYGRKGQHKGPVDSPQLQKLVGLGRVLPADLAWHDGLSEWTAIRDLPELSTAVSEATANVWYYGQNGEQQGPASLLQVRKLIAAGKVGQDWLAWKEGMAEWAAVSTLAVFAGIKQSAKADTPVKPPAMPTRKTGPPPPPPVRTPQSNAATAGKATKPPKSAARKTSPPPSPKSPPTTATPDQKLHIGWVLTFCLVIVLVFGAGGYAVWSIATNSDDDADSKLRRKDVADARDGDDRDGGDKSEAPNGRPDGRRAGAGPNLAAAGKSDLTLKAIYDKVERKQREFNELCGENPRMRIIGEIRDRTGDVLSIWGRAIPTNGNLSAKGTLLENGNIRVLNAKTSAIRANFYAGGMHYFVSRSTAKNAFGVEVPVNNFAAPPPDLKAKSDELEDSEKDYQAARRAVVARTLREFSKPKGSKADEISRLEQTIDGMKALESFRGITVGETRDVLDALPQEKVVTKLSDAQYAYVFPEDGVIINCTANLVEAITYAIDAFTLGSYFSFMKEFEIKPAATTLALDAPLLSEHALALGRRGVGPVWNTRTAELVEITLTAADGTPEQSEFRFTCMTADRLIRILGVSVFNTAVVGLNTSSLPFDTSNTDAEPLLKLKLNPGSRLTKTTESLPPVNYQALRQTWKGHHKPVLDIKFSPNGSRAVSGDEDGKVILWHTGRGKVLHTFEGHSDKVTAVAYAKGDRIVSGASDGKMRFWDAGSMKPIGQVSAHESDVLDVAVSGDGRRAITGGKDRNIHVWDVSTGDKVKSLPVQNDWVAAVAISPDGKTALTGCRDGVVTVWDVDAGTAKHKFEQHKAGVRQVAFKGDGKQALSGGDDRVLYLWEVNGGKVVRKFVGSHDSGRGTFGPDETNLTALAAGDGLRAISGHQSGIVFSWNLGYPRQEQFLGFRSRDYQNKRGITSVGCSPNGRHLLVAYGDAEIVWQMLPPTRAAGETPVGLLASFGDGQFEGISSFALSPDNQLLAIHQGQQNELLVYQLDSGEELVRAKLGPLVEHVTISPDARWAAVSFEGAARKPYAEIWDLRTGKTHRQQPSSHGTDSFSLKLHGFTFSQDGQRLVYLDSHPSRPTSFLLMACETESGKQLGRRALRAQPRTLSVSPDYKWLVSVGNGLSQLVDAEFKGVVASSKVQGVFSPNSQYYAYVKAQGELEVLDLITKESRTLSVPARSMPVFTADGKRFAVEGAGPPTLNDQKPIDIYDVGTGRKTRTVKGGRVFQFTPNGKHMISGSMRGQITVSDIENETTLHEFKPTRSFDGVEHLLVSPDGRLAVSSDQTGKVYVWGLPR